MSKTILATLTLIGATIGAGVLGIPYVVLKSGFGFGVLIIIFVALLMLLTNLYLGEIALRTKGTHQLSGYAEKYLGPRGKKIMFLAIVFGVYAALVAYLIGEGESLSYLFFNTVKYEIIMGTFFWIILAALSWFGLKALEEGEEIGVTFVFITIISIVVFSWNKINPSNLSYNDASQIFSPFGVVLFAFLGFSAVPEVIRILKKEKGSLEKAIISSNLIVLSIYIIFTAVVLGWKGSATPPLATLVLGKPFVLLGMITMFTAYLVHTNALIDTLRFDFRKTRFHAWLIAISVPLLAFIVIRFLNIAGFIKVLSIGGAISGGLTAILILFMVKKAKQNGDEKPSYSIPYSNILAWILIAIFALGAIFEITSSF